MATNPPRSPKPFIIALIFMALVSVGFTWVAVQQNYRQNANDPQTQLAADAAASLSAGASPKDVLGINAAAVDPSTSLATFVTIVSSSGTVQASTMKDAILPPNGVLAAATTTRQNRVTWQPQTGTRVALVVQAYSHSGQLGYVLAGRSLKEVETREDMLARMAIAVALVLFVTGGTAYILYGKR